MININTLNTPMFVSAKELNSMFGCNMTNGISFRNDDGAINIEDMTKLIYENPDNGKELIELLICIGETYNKKYNKSNDDLATMQKKLDNIKKLYRIEMQSRMEYIEFLEQSIENKDKLLKKYL